MGKNRDSGRVGLKMFDYTLKILAQEIAKLERLRSEFHAYQLDNKIEELKFVIEILNRGQGYLTVGEPVKVKFFKELDDKIIKCLGFDN